MQMHAFERWYPFIRDVRLVLLVVECEVSCINMTSTMSPLIKVTHHPPNAPPPEAPLKLSSIAALIAGVQPSAAFVCRT